MAQDNVNKAKFHPLRSIDGWTILFYLLLIACGWVCVVGASYNYGDTNLLDLSARSGKQLIWIGCSFVLALAIMLTDDRIYDTFANAIYVCFMVVLLITPFIATNHKGSYSWISFGSISIQPAEFAKCATALALAKCMGTYGFTLSKASNALRAAAIILLPIALIILQRETGSALVYLAFLLMFYREGMSGCVLYVIFTVIVIFVVGLRYDPSPMPHTLTSLGRTLVLTFSWLFTDMLLWLFTKQKRMARDILIVGTIVTVASYLVSCYIIEFDIAWPLFAISAFAVGYVLVESLRQRLPSLLLTAAFTIGSLGMYYSIDHVMESVLRDHQRTRILVLVGLTDDIHNAGYNVHQSEIAIGSGGLEGKGFLHGTQTKLNYVPEQDTDFIFCTVGEEHGFIGCAFVLTLFLLLILRLIHLAERQVHAFGRIFGYCVLSIFFFHVFINVGMVMGLTPVIGIPLPFFSYGGSSLWGFTILLFIFLRIDSSRSRYRR